MITILCPSRGRPNEFKRMVESARQTAHEPGNVRVMLFTGNDDPRLHDYPKEIANGIRFIGQPWSAVMASNYLAMKCAEYYPDTLFYMVGSDDMVFATPEWDKALLEAYNAAPSNIHVFSLRDSRDAKGTPHPILTHAYVRAMGYFLPPLFLHWFVDSWTVEIARANNCFTHLMDYLLIHDKPSDRGQADDTHNRIRALGWHERDTYVNNTCGHFLELEKSRLKRALEL